MRILDVLTPGVQVHNYNFAMTLDSKIYINKINLLYNKAPKSYIYVNYSWQNSWTKWLKFFRSRVTKAKQIFLFLFLQKSFFSKIDFFLNQNCFKNPRATLQQADSYY